MIQEDILCELAGLSNLRGARTENSVRSACAGLIDQNPILEHEGYAMERLGLGNPTLIENDL